MAESVKLEFHLAPLGKDCLVTVNGQTVERITSLDIHTAWDDVTSFVLEGILAEGTTVSFAGRLFLDAKDGD